MIKFTLLFLTAAIFFIGTTYADNANNEGGAPHISGAKVEEEVEAAIDNISKDIDGFKEKNPSANTEDLNSTLEEAKRIKALNDALSHFAEAMKFVLMENLHGLEDRTKKIMATVDLQTAVSKLTGKSDNNDEEEGDDEKDES